MQQQQKRILIIDDDQDITTTLQINLEHNGFKADSYTDPVAAYENFTDGQYDLVLLDIKMPNGDGFYVVPKDKKEG